MKTYSCCVDAGCICMIPMELAEKWGYERDTSLVHEIKGCGTYRCKASIEDSWAGPINMEFDITSEKGFILGDLCYVLRVRWSGVCGWLDSPPGGVCFHTGGDGEFEVNLEMEEVKDEP